MPTGRWQQQFIQKIQNVNSTLWEIRNTLIYGNDKEKITREQQRLVPTITSYYHIYQHIISTRYHNIFNTLLAIRLTFSPTKNKQWINTVKDAQKITKRNSSCFTKSTQKLPNISNISKESLPQQTSLKKTTQENQEKLQQPQTPQKYTILGAHIYRSHSKDFNHHPLPQQMHLLS